MFKTILFPIDQSRDSQEAAEMVAQIVKYCNSRLFVLSVHETPTTEGEPPPSVPSAQAVAQLLDNAKSTFAGWGIQVETMQREGIPAFTICDVADEIGIDLIVMGCHGTGLTEEGIAESVSSRVINLSPCPVLVVP